MRVEVTQDDSKVTMTVIGRLDTLTSPEFDKIIQPYLSIPELKLIVEVSQMEYISSSGLRSFIKLLKMVNAKDGTMAIVGMTPYVKEIFDMTGFSSLFLMLPSLDDIRNDGNFSYYFLGKKSGLSEIDG